MAEDEKKTLPDAPENKPDDDWVSSMKDEMEEYMEEQGIYIRQ